ncbi:MAG: hypothetical protein H6816_01360 [Phycisphaerales bacterium]|nr:hypothetical protein [Phycisphaerales bacterium]
MYIHTRSSTAAAATMSKSKGNGVDPLDIVTTYGASTRAAHHGRHGHRNAGRAHAGGSGYIWPASRRTFCRPSQPLWKIPR